MRVSVENDDRVALASELVSPTPSGIREVLLHIGTLDRRFRVVDVDGAPIAGAEVSLVSEAGGSWTSPATSARGETSVTGLQAGAYLAFVSHDELGFRPAVPVVLTPGSGESVELVLDADETLTVQLMGPDGPVAGAVVEVRDAVGYVYLGQRRSDEGGVVDWSGLGRGEYEFRVDDPRYFLLGDSVELPQADAPLVVTLNPVGELVLRVVGPGGEPLAGARAVLDPVEYSQTLLDWIRAHFVPIAESDLTTGADGEIRLAGLPSGPFSWIVTPPGGGTAVEGEVVVAPGETTIHEVWLP